MNFEQYQKKSKKTAQYPSLYSSFYNEDFFGFGDKGRCSYIYPVLGLAGETGEVVELIKKAVRSDSPVDREKLKYELGDVLWYLSQLATECGLKLNEIAEANIVKLQKRYGK